MAEENGEYQVYATKPLVPQGPQLIITALYRTRPEGRDFGSDRAEWFVLTGEDPEPVKAQTIGYSIGSPSAAASIQVTDEVLLRAAWDEAILEAQHHQPEDALAIDDKASGKDLLVNYWIRGRCIKGLEKLAETTKCPALRRDLADIRQLRPLRRADLLTGKPVNY